MLSIERIKHFVMELLSSDAWNSSLSNVSSNGTYEDEFPYWKIAMAERIICVFFILFPIAIFFNFSVLLTFLKTSSLRRPLNMMHIALMVELFLVKYTDIFLGLGTFPDGVRFCICRELNNEVYLAFNAFNIVFVSVLLACVSVIQFLIVKGKRKLVNWKVVFALVAGSTLYSVTLAVVSFFGNRIQGTPLLCASLCTENPGSQFTNFSFALIGIVGAVLVPCLVVIFFTLLWTCLIFKENYIGNDDQLNQRIVSITAIMPLVTIFTSVFFFLLQQLVANILRQFVTSFYPNWVLAFAEFLGNLLEGVSGFIYPIVLLYVHPTLRAAWITMLKRVRRALKKKENNSRVHPEMGVSSLESQTKKGTHLNN